MSNYDTRRSLAAEAAFRDRLNELGAILLEPTWLGSRTPHRVRCAQGHDCTPRPAKVQSGEGICRTCARKDPKVAETVFRARLVELGAILLETAWLGTDNPHRVRCIQGHDCTPRPANVRRGQGICRTCAGQDPTAAEAAFRARVTELGGTVLEPTWLGIKKPHRARCIQGHDCTPYPSVVQKGQGICRTCAGQDPKVAEAAFRARVVELGGTTVEPIWLGSGKKHRVRCREGHESSPIPDNVQQGGGICATCAGQIWDVLYVVTDETAEVVKVGITSGDPRPRLARHRSDHGLDQVVRLLTGLPDGVAQELERNVLAALRDVDERPTRGKEYFPGRALALMLDLIDHHPAVRGTLAGASEKITGPARC